MTYGLAPLATDSDAPLPSGIAYEETTEPHEGCPRDGFLAWRIDDFTGASVSCCTRCRYRRVHSMTTATAEALRLRAEAEEAEAAGKALPAALLAELAPRPGEPAPRICERPECDRVAVRRYCSPQCYLAHRRGDIVAREVAADRRCECGCFTLLTTYQQRYASRECSWRGRRMEKAGKYLARCEDCPAEFERSTRAHGAVRCPACQRAAHRQKDKARVKELLRIGRAALAAQRAGAGQVAA